MATVAGDQDEVTVASDGDGGVFAAWTDSRAGVPRIYGQHIGSGGEVAGNPDRILLSRPGSEAIAPLIAGTGFHEAIVCWHDARSDAKWDIYAQRLAIGTSGIPGVVENSPGAAMTVNPNPFRSSAEVAFHQTRAGTVTMELFDPAGQCRASRELIATTGWNRFTLTDADDSGAHLASGRYTVRIRSAGTTHTSQVVVIR